MCDLQTHYTSKLIMNKSFLYTTLFSLCAFSLPCFSAQQQVLTTAAAIAQVKSTVEKEKLVERPQCVDYVYFDKASPRVVIIKVVEKHNDTCGGAPGVAPRLFSVYVDLVTHEMASDKDDIADGTLKMLPPPK